MLLICFFFVSSIQIQAQFTILKHFKVEKGNNIDIHLTLSRLSTFVFIAIEARKEYE